MTLIFGFIFAIVALFGGLIIVYLRNLRNDVKELSNRIGKTNESENEMIEALRRRVGSLDFVEAIFLSRSENDKIYVIVREHSVEFLRAVIAESNEALLETSSLWGDKYEFAMRASQGRDPSRAVPPHSELIYKKQ